MLKMNEYDSKTKAQLYIQKSLELGGPKMKSNLTSQRTNDAQKNKGVHQSNLAAGLTDINGKEYQLKRTLVFLIFVACDNSPLSICE